MYWIFLVLIVIHGRAIKTWFLRSHICSICLRLDNRNSLIEIYYLQIEPREKWTHTNECMMLKMFYLHGIAVHLMGYRKQIFTRLWAFWVSHWMNEFLQWEIKWKLSSVQNIYCITAIADKKKSIFCAFGVLCYWLQSAVEIK